MRPCRPVRPALRGSLARVSEADAIECPECGKRARRRPGMTGKRALCRCGNRFVVLPPEDSAGEQEPDGPIELAGVAPAWMQGVEAVAAPGPCVRCNHGLKPGAVICLNCGTDQRSGQPMAAPTISKADPSEAGDEDHNDDAPGRWQLTATLWGLHARLAALVLYGLAFALGVVAGFEPAVGVVALGVGLLGVGLSTVGAFLCLAAPVNPLGRTALAASLSCSLGGLGFSAWSASSASSAVPGWAADVGEGLPLLGALLFLGFLLALAEYVDFPEVSEAAGKVFGCGVAALVVGLAAGFVPFVGLLLVLIALLLLVVALWRYGVLLIDLAASVAYRRDRA